MSQLARDHQGLLPKKTRDAVIQGSRKISGLTQVADYERTDVLEDVFPILEANPDAYHVDEDEYFSHEDDFSSRDVSVTVEEFVARASASKKFLRNVKPNTPGGAQRLMQTLLFRIPGAFASAYERHGVGTRRLANGSTVFVQTKFNNSLWTASQAAGVEPIVYDPNDTNPYALQLALLEARERIEEADQSLGATHFLGSNSFKYGLQKQTDDTGTKFVWGGVNDPFKGLTPAFSDHLGRLDAPGSVVGWVVAQDMLPFRQREDIELVENPFAEKYYGRRRVGYLWTSMAGFNVIDGRAAIPIITPGTNPNGSQPVADTQPEPDPAMPNGNPQIPGNEPEEEPAP